MVSRNSMRLVNDRAPARQFSNYVVYPLLSLEVATPENTPIHSALPSTLQESLPHERFLGGCGSIFMRLAEHLTALRAWRDK